MDTGDFKVIIERVSKSEEPTIEFIRRASATGKRLGVFASSFNPVTVAHIELMNLAREQFSLDESLALSGAANADKSAYECPLEDRLLMLALALEADSDVSIGISSHAYFIDMTEALGRRYPPETDLHFIIGFDTFERVLDFDDRYTARYHLRLSDRREALHRLVERVRLIVAGRAGAGKSQVRALVDRERDILKDRVSFLATPGDLAERSASEVRARLRSGRSIRGLVPAAVETFLLDHGIYRAG